MNPLTNIKNQQKLTQRELDLGLSGSKVSWHSQYKDSAWLFIGGLPYDLTEGDIIAVFSQYGEVVNLNLVRDKDTGKSKGYCFLCYEDQRSTILAVDNFNGIKLLGRMIRVDHVADYKKPKGKDDDDDITKRLQEEGCAPKITAAASLSEDDATDMVNAKKIKKEKKKKHKKEKKKKREKAKKRSTESSDSDEDGNHKTNVKKEKISPNCKQEVSGTKSDFKHSRDTSRGDSNNSRNRSRDAEQSRHRDSSSDPRDTQRDRSSNSSRNRSRDVEQFRHKDSSSDPRNRDSHRDSHSRKDRDSHRSTRH